MTAEHSSIACEIRDAVARIVLRRPPLNIIDMPMMEELRGALEQVQSTEGIKLVVLDHEGKAFSAGVSIQDHTPDKVKEMIEKFHSLFHLLWSLAMPSLTFVDGAALGGGCELAVASDMVIASDRASFGQPEIKVGVFPPAAAALFPRLVGRNRALELLLTGAAITAAEAESIGLINKVFPAESFRAQAEKFIGELAAMSAPVLRLAKRAVDSSVRAGLGEGIAIAEKIYLGELMQTEDAREGLNAFLEKRKPVWKNR